MNIHSLDHYLRELSDSEKLYLSGYRYTSWDELPSTQIDGRKVYIVSSPHSAVSDTLPHPHKGDPAVLSASLTPDMELKKNSRFSPVPEHIHSHVEINYVYSGQCPQTIDRKRVILQKNQVLLIDTACPHSIDKLGMDDIMISLIVQKEFLRNTLFSYFSKDSIVSRFFINALNEQTDHDHFLHFHSENNRRIPFFFQELFCECYDPSINSDTILLHLFYLIMAELLNVYEKDMVRSQELFSTSPIVPLLHYIENNYLTCTQKSVADFFHISQTYVSILLKKYIGMSYIQLIQEQKLMYAAELLRSTQLSVVDIVNEAGYENISFFYKKFRQKYGCSPKDFRKHPEL